MTTLTQAPVTGIVSAHPRGFGFITTEAGTDHFVPPPLMRKLLPGDVVTFVESTDATGKTAVVSVQMVARPESFWLGELGRLRNGQPGFVADEAVHVQLQLPPGHGLQPGEVAQVRVAAGTPVATQVPVTVERKLGPRNDRGFDVDYAIAKWRLPTTWPADFGAEFTAPVAVDRTDCPFVTIDGESTRDFDDAVYVEPWSSGLRLVVAIADVSAYVRPGSALDQEARRRGTSVYFPDRVVPMLPEVLSTGLCSLLPGAVRSVLLCTLEFGSGGRILHYRFERGRIRSRARLTYQQVTAQVEGQARLADPDLATQVDRLHALYRQLEPQRAARGLLEYRGREPKLRRTEDGAWQVDWEYPGIAHAIVEECMLAANRAAASQLALNGQGMLFRHHQGVDPEKWAETRAWLAEHGVAAPAAPTLTQLRELLEFVREHELQPVIAWRVRRSFAPAVYDDSHSAHYTLGFLTYTHFTSPIRRYADLVVHRLLLGEVTTLEEAVAAGCSALARRAQLASRYPWDRAKRRALWQQPERQYAAQVVTMSRRGLKAVVDDWDTAVFVAAADLAAVGLTWDEPREAWVNGRAMELGTPVTVRLRELVDQGPECELLATLEPS